MQDKLDYGETLFFGSKAHPFRVYSKTLTAGEGKSRWAGAQRPKARRRDLTLTENGRTDVYTQSPALSLSLKLRQQALKAGIKPGSDRWRAYVLGGLAAAKRRKAKKRNDGETGPVTPGK
jgi:hypothetical protein